MREGHGQNFNRVVVLLLVLEATCEERIRGMLTAREEGRKGKGKGKTWYVHTHHFTCENLDG